MAERRSTARPMVSFSLSLFCLALLHHHQIISSVSQRRKEEEEEWCTTPCLVGVPIHAATWAHSSCGALHIIIAIIPMGVHPASRP